MYFVHYYYVLHVLSRFILVTPFVVVLFLKSSCLLASINKIAPLEQFLNEGMFHYLLCYPAGIVHNQESAKSNQRDLYC